MQNAQQCTAPTLRRCAGHYIPRRLGEEETAQCPPMQVRTEQRGRAKSNYTPCRADGPYGADDDDAQLSYGAQLTLAPRAHAVRGSSLQIISIPIREPGAISQPSFPPPAITPSFLVA